MRPIARLRLGILIVAIGAAWIATVLTIAAAPQDTAAPSTPPSSSPERPAPVRDPGRVVDRRAVLTQYCVTCHNERLRTGGLALDTIPIENVGEHADVWEKVVRKLRSGAMPPNGRPRPEAPVIAQLVQNLEHSLDEAAAAHPDPGRPAIHRVNRAEYGNAVRDILGLEIDSRGLLPADDANEQGFNNIADSLSMSPALLERYLSASRTITRLALGLPPATPVTDSYRLPQKLSQDARMSEDLPFGSRGGLAIRHTFPVEGEYEIVIELQRNIYGLIRGLGEAHQIQLRIDRELVETGAIGGKAPGDMPPLTFGGTIQGTPDWEAYLRDADAGLRFRVAVKAGTHLVAVSFLDDYWIPENIPQPQSVSLAVTGNEMYDGKPAVETLSIGGPYKVVATGKLPSRARISLCQPASAGDEACARRILSTVARRAYRRPVSDADLEPLLRLFGSRTGAGFDERLQLPLQMIFADPDFLFRVEHAPTGVRPGQAHRVSDIDLASRLSFFLWSSVPDEKLLDLAVRGKLHEPAILEGQVRRMLTDDRAHALVENFASQWLAFRNIRDTTPDQDLFIDFDENLRDAFFQETQLFIASQLHEDRSIVDLLSADYTFANERLARHYGIPDVYGAHFRKVTLPKGVRGGLLGQGSVLTITSYPNRTSPVLRGKWLLETILGTPPPEPPPNVPALKEAADDGTPTSVRKRLEAHRRNPACATCHAVIDPLGFALENFDAVGAWRTADGGTPVDASGALPGSSPFTGLSGLKDLLTGPRRDQFIGTFTERLLAYALGRNLEAYDYPVVRRIAREAARDNARWSAIILGIVRSTPFQMRRVES